MTRYKAIADIPNLTNWGGIRSVQRQMKRSATLEGNREAVAYQLLCMASTKITDIMTWDESGNVTVKQSSKIPDQALQAIKKVSVRTDKEGNSYLDIELYDKIGVLRLLAKASGLLDNPDNESSRPSVIDVNVVAPSTGEQ